MTEHPKTMKNDPEHNLEAMLEAHGLDVVLGALARSCNKKGHTLRYEAQDYKKADGWYRAGELISAANRDILEAFHHV
jgi:hypothetical protein